MVKNCERGTVTVIPGKTVRSVCILVFEELNENCLGRSGLDENNFLGNWKCDINLTIV